MRFWIHLSMRSSHLIFLHFLWCSYSKLQPRRFYLPFSCYDASCTGKHPAQLVWKSSNPFVLWDRSKIIEVYQYKSKVKQKGNKFIIIELDLNRNTGKVSKISHNRWNYLHFFLIGLYKFTKLLISSEYEKKHSFFLNFSLIFALLLLNYTRNKF